MKQNEKNYKIGLELKGWLKKVDRNYIEAMTVSVERRQNNTTTEYRCVCLVDIHVARSYDMNSTNFILKIEMKT